jgi:phenylalanine-4-hydroxylase
MVKDLFTYSVEDNSVWRKLLHQQLPLVEKYACREYLQGLKIINFSSEYIPSLIEVSNHLFKLTAWQLKPVEQIVSNREFFKLLSEKTFPVIRKIRSEKEIDFYTNESPDVFHEYFGHCPMLTNGQYAKLMHKMGLISINLDCKKIDILSKIFWNTFEFGIIYNSSTLKIYGAGILPSRVEIQRVINNPETLLQKFDIFTSLNATLKGNINQPQYFYINDLDDLHDMIYYDIPMVLSS